MNALILILAVLSQTAVKPDRLDLDAQIWRFNPIYGATQEFVLQSVDAAAINATTINTENLDATGSITVSGTVDSYDVSTMGLSVDALVGADIILTNSAVTDLSDGSNVLKADGTVPLTGDWNAGSARTVSVGTARVTSATAALLSASNGTDAVNVYHDGTDGHISSNDPPTDDLVVGFRSIETTSAYIGPNGSYPCVFGNVGQAKTASCWAVRQENNGTTAFNVPTGRWFYMQSAESSFFRTNPAGLQMEFDPNGAAAATLYVGSNVDRIGILTEAPSTILDVVAGSATDPVADAWDLHCLEALKENIESVTPATQAAISSRIDAIQLVLANRKMPPKPDIKNYQDDPSDSPEQPQTAQEKYDADMVRWTENVKSPKRHVKNLTVVAETLPREYQVFDADGKLIGASMVAMMFDQYQEIKSLRKRVETLEKVR